MTFNFAISFPTKNQKAYQVQNFKMPKEISLKYMVVNIYIHKIKEIIIKHDTFTWRRRKRRDFR